MGRRRETWLAGCGAGQRRAGVAAYVKGAEQLAATAELRGAASPDHNQLCNASAACPPRAPGLPHRPIAPGGAFSGKGGPSPSGHSPSASHSHCPSCTSPIEPHAPCLVAQGVAESHWQAAQAMLAACRARTRGHGGGQGAKGAARVAGRRRGVAGTRAEACFRSGSAGGPQMCILQADSSHYRMATGARKLKGGRAPGTPGTQV